MAEEIQEKEYYLGYKVDRLKVVEIYKLGDLSHPEVELWTECHMDVLRHNARDAFAFHGSAIDPTSPADNNSEVKTFNVIVLQASKDIEALEAKLESDRKTGVKPNPHIKVLLDQGILVGPDIWERRK